MSAVYLSTRAELTARQRRLYVVPDEVRAQPAARAGALERPVPIDPARKPVRAHIEWLRLRNLARSTIHCRWTCLLALQEVRHDILRADHIDIIAVLGSRPLGPTTRNLWRSHYSSFFAWAIDEGLVEKNPAKRVPLAAAPEALPRPISEDALALALDRADQKMVAWLVLAAYAGLRVAEISALTGADVDLDSRTLRVVMGKRRKDRNLPLHPRVACALEPFLAAGPGRLWPNPPKVVGMFIGRYLHGLGIDDTAHSLRHRFATQIYDQTGDIHLVRDLLGHQSTETTQVYAKGSVARRAAAVEGLA